MSETSREKEKLSKWRLKEGELAEGRQFSDHDLRNEEVVMGIFERGVPEEVEELRAFHNLTLEQIDVMKYYVHLRQVTHSKMRVDIEERMRTRPEATNEEFAMGAYQEAIEPQVRNAMAKLQSKGYTTTSSGFSGLSNQAISFQYPHKAQLSSALIERLGKRGITVRVEEKRISFDCSQNFTLEELKNAWDQIADDLPDLNNPASPSNTPAAQSFRHRRRSR